MKVILDEDKGGYGYGGVRGEMDKGGFMVKDKRMERVMGELGVKRKIGMVG